MKYQDLNMINISGGGSFSANKISTIEPLRGNKILVSLSSGRKVVLNAFTIAEAEHIISEALLSIDKRPEFPVTIDGEFYVG